MTTREWLWSLSALSTALGLSLFMIAVMMRAFFGRWEPGIGIASVTVGIPLIAAGISAASSIGFADGP